MGRWWRVVAVGVVGVVFTGCGGGSQSGAPVVFSTGPVPSVVSVAPVSSVVSSPEPRETFTVEQQEAADAGIRFLKVRFQVESDLDAPTQELADLVTGQARVNVMTILNEKRMEGIILTGEVGVYLEGVEEVREEDPFKTVTVLACTDSRNADAVKADSGESILDETRAYFIHWRMNVAYENNYSWRIQDWTSERGEPCVS